MCVSKGGIWGTHKFSDPISGKFRHGVMWKCGMCSMLQIGGYSIALWLVFQIIGVISLGLGATWLNHRRYGDWRVQSDIGLWVFLAMLAGARFAFVLQNGRPLHEAMNLFTVGYVSTGGIPAILLVLVFYTRFRGVGFVRLLDSLAPFAALCEMFGHVGCFMAGCCFGTPTNSSIGVAFPFDSLPYHFHLAQGLIGPTALTSLPIHPVQLYNAVISLGMYIILLSFSLRNPRPCIVTLMFLFCHGLQRFTIQFFRGNHVPYILGLRLPQAAALILCLAVAVLTALVIYQNRRDSACTDED